MVGYIEYIFLFILGAIFGSFASFVGYRLFNEEHNIIGTRSICCSCKKNILFRDLIPIVSFILLRGKCRFCKNKIPMWHFIAELFLAITFIVSVYYFNGINVCSVLFCIIIWCLVVQSIIDFRVMMSSDVIHLIELICCAGLSLKIDNNINNIFIMPCGTVLFFIIISFVMKKILKKDCLGFGDIKLFAILSILFNFEQYVIFIGLSGIFGIIFYFLTKNKLSVNSCSISGITVENDENKYFPFIPAITIAFLLAFYIKNVKLI